MRTEKNSLYFLTLIFINPCLMIDTESRKDSIRWRPYLTEDAQLNFTELGSKLGQSVKEFDVLTEDGYILTIFHVIPKKEVQINSPILLLHGMFDGADSFILRGNTSLAVALARAGYDVWVGNNRGNRYGRRHLKLNPDNDKAFWNYTVHEMALFDITAMIDFILNETGANKVNAIGHSLGNTQLFILGSTRPEYNNKINIMVALSPIVFLKHIKPPVTDIIASADILLGLFEALGQEEIFADNSFVKEITLIVCSQTVLSYELCAQGVLMSTFGLDPMRFERDFLPILIGHVPQAGGRKQMKHLAQFGKGKGFAKFDYGLNGNLDTYGSKTPPNYDLNKVTMKVALYEAKNDKTSTMEDVRLLKKQLPNVVEHVVMKPSNWNHIDWIWGLEMEKYFHPPLLKTLANHVSY